MESGWNTLDGSGGSRGGTGLALFPVRQAQAVRQGAAPALQEPRLLNTGKALALTLGLRQRAGQGGRRGNSGNGGGSREPGPEASVLGNTQTRVQSAGQPHPPLQEGEGCVSSLGKGGRGEMVSGFSHRE